jgi:ribonuclease P protein component
MKKTIMIKKNYEFKILFSKGKFYHGEYVHMYIKTSNQPINKFGIAVSKKQGKAVKRNHIKRLIRENYKNFEGSIKTGTSILIIINKNKDIKDISFKQIEENFLRTLKKANVLVD